MRIQPLKPCEKLQKGKAQLRILLKRPIGAPLSREELVFRIEKRKEQHNG